MLHALLPCSLALTLAFPAVQTPSAPAPAPAPAPAEEDPWAPYETPQAPPPTPTAAPAPPPAAPAPSPSAEDRPRQPGTGLGLLVTGPILVGLGAPFSFWGNRTYRNGCIAERDVNQSVDEVLDDGFACGLAATGSFLLHGLAFVLYAGGAAMTGGGGMKKGKHDAWEDAFVTRDPRSSVGFMAGGGALLGVSMVAMVTSRTLLWTRLGRCLTTGCVKSRQTISTAVTSGSMLGVAAGAALLGYGLSYRRRIKRWAPELLVLPSAAPGRFGVTLVGRY